MDEKKILIVNLSKGKMGEANSALLGALVITKLYLAAMSRVDIPEEQRSDFFLYVDEFQNFATESFVHILSEARKYRLSLTLAHQYIAQMEEKVRDAVFGNVGTIIAFRVGAEDAEYLEKEFAPVITQEDLVNLPKYNIYVKLMIDGVAGKPFSAETLPPLPKLEHSFKNDIIEYSRKTYAHPREEVERMIAKWAEPIRREEEKKQRREGISLKEALKSSPIPFFIPKRKSQKDKRERKEPKIDELKEVLEEALEKKETQTSKEDDQKKNNNDKEGVLKPNNGVIFP